MCLGFPMNMKNRPTDFLQKITRISPKCNIPRKDLNIFLNDAKMSQKEASALSEHLSLKQMFNLLQFAEKYLNEKSLHGITLAEANNARKRVAQTLMMFEGNIVDWNLLCFDIHIDYFF